MWGKTLLVGAGLAVGAVRPCCRQSQTSHIHTRSPNPPTLPISLCSQLRALMGSFDQLPPGDLKFLLVGCALFLFLLSGP